MSVRTELMLTRTPIGLVIDGNCTAMCQVDVPCGRLRIPRPADAYIAPGVRWITAGKMRYQKQSPGIPIAYPQWTGAYADSLPGE